MSRDKNVHGIFVVGHGNKTNLGTNDYRTVKKDSITIAFWNAERQLDYKLGFVFLNTCESGWSRKDKGMPIDEDFFSDIEAVKVVFGAGVVAGVGNPAKPGGKDLVSPNGFFRGYLGACGPIKMSGELGVLVEKFDYPPNIFLPGAQGTKQKVNLR